MPVAVKNLESGIENLRLLTSGPLPPNPSELLGSQKMRQLVEHLRDKADIVIFDTPPSLVVTDASVLALETDGVLVLVDAGRTRRTAAQQTVERLQQTVWEGRQPHRVIETPVFEFAA